MWCGDKELGGGDKRAVWFAKEEPKLQYARRPGKLRAGKTQKTDRATVQTQDGRQLASPTHAQPHDHGQLGLQPPHLLTHIIRLSASASSS